MAVTLIVHQSFGPSQPVGLWPLATVNGDDLIVRLPNGGGGGALAGFQALRDSDADAVIGRGDGWQGAQANGAAADGDVITYLLIHTIGESDVRRYDIQSGDEILVYPRQIIEFPFTSGDQMRLIVDGDHLVIKFPGELGFLTLLNFQKYLLDPETAAHLEWGLGGNIVAIEKACGSGRNFPGGIER